MDAHELQKLLADHETWLTSHGNRGERAELAEADLRDAPLRNANLRKANLTSANLRGTDLFGTSLIEADLQGADLTDVTGLCSQQVAGANLSGAKLSGTVAISDGLAQVGELSKNTARTFVFLILACVYCWLTIATTTDARLLTNFVSTPLPVIQAAIPLYLFYLIVPVILLAVYLYLHLQLLDLWQEVAEVPAIFPDGRSVSQKIHPWLLAVLVRSLMPARHNDRSPRFLAALISHLLTWWLLPITLAIFWLRYLPRHDLPGSSVQAGLLGLASFLGVWSQQRALRFLSHKRLRWSITAALAVGIIVFACCLTVSYGAITGINETAEEYRTPVGPASGFDVLTSLRTGIPQLLSRVGGRAFADMKDAVVSNRPNAVSFSPAPMLTSPHGDLSLAREAIDDDALRGVLGADLRGKDLRYAIARGAFLVRADLTRANLRGADLSFAYLQEANLEDANLRMAYLSRAQMDRADMKAARMQDAYLGEARMRRADLRSAQLTDAILVDADLQDADLTFGQLDGAILSNANLANAVLFGTSLHGANLEFARNLTQAQINDAFTDCSTILPVGMTRPMPCPTPASTVAAPDLRCQIPEKLPVMRNGVYTIALKSDSATCSVVMGSPGGAPKDIVRALDKAPANVRDLPFRPVVAGRFYTFTPIPPGAPRGTQVVNLPPGDGRSGYFRLAFIAPEGFSSVRLKGFANADDTGRVFLNGTAISPSLFSTDAITEFGNVSFSVNRTTMFKPGVVNEILISDLNTGAGPSGAAFYFTITFRK
ncbi:MAG TPA: pentapeptide repeat-containing protein [Thermoanaerobaculia bacterium]|nr:pentapeptide repeat-containing protein [Thermoanaerobaculia bacterium]